MSQPPLHEVPGQYRTSLARGAPGPPAARGVPSNTGGIGATDTAAEVFGHNEIEPFQRRLAVQ